MSKKIVTEQDVQSLLQDMPQNLRNVSKAKRVKVEEMFPGEGNKDVRDALNNKGFSDFRFANGNQGKIGVITNNEGYVTAIAAKVTRSDIGRSYDRVTEVQDFREDTRNRADKIPVFYRVYAQEGLINNAINKTAALVSAEGEFFVRRARMGNKKIANVEEELMVLLDYWKRNVNSGGLEGPVTGARGLKAVFDQATRQALIEGSWVGYQHYSTTDVPPLGKSYDIPMFLQSLSTQYIEIPEGLEGTGLEQFYWVPPQEIVNSLVSSDDEDIRDLVEKSFDKDAISQLDNDGRVKLERDRILHIKHRGVDIMPFGECYDEETEILTKNRGWVRFDSLLEGEEVATRTKEGIFEWQKPTAYAEHDHDGPMYEFNSRSVDLKVTPNHRMLVTGVNPNLGLSNGSENIVTAEELYLYNNQHTKIPVTSEWEAEDMPPKTLVVEDNFRAEEVEISGDDYCALMGAYLSEGNIKPQSGIEINQFSSSKYWDMYNELIVGKLGGCFWENSSEEGQTQSGVFVLPKKAFGEHFKLFGRSCDEKFIPQEIMQTSKRQLAIFWDFFVAGDGCSYQFSENQRGNQPQKGVSITTTSRLMADQLVEIAQKLGFSASVYTRRAGNSNRESYRKESYVVRCRDSKAMSVNTKKVNYKGKVYCVQVPNGIVYVRRNGKPSWCGNSFIEPVLSDIAYKRALQSLDMVIIEAMINRVLILKVGSDDPNSDYHSIEFAQQRLNLLKNMFDTTDPSMTILWAGPDLDVLDVGVHDSLANLDGRYEIARENMLDSIGTPESLLGRGSTGQVWAAYEGYRETLRSMQNAFAQSMVSLGEKIAQRNGFEGVQLEFKFSRSVLADQNANADLSLRKYKSGLSSIREAVAATGSDFLSERRNKLLERGEDPENTDITDEELFAPPIGFPGETRVTPDGNVRDPGGEGGRPNETQREDLGRERDPEDRNTTTEQ